MAQDCEKLFERDDIDMDIVFHGENTLVSALWAIAQENNQHKTFGEMFDD